MDQVHDDDYARRAASFGTQAAAYAEYRPDYPVALLEWGLAPVRDSEDLHVLDIGAGTGKLTEGLHALGVPVVAVEPDAAMLAQLKRRLPDVRTHVGSAESIPLPDAFVDAVFVGQALHWFDLDRAFREIGRVLRPGGHLVAAWNYYDDREPWLAGMCDVSDTIPWSRRGGDPVEWLGRFGDVVSAEFPHQVVRTVDGMVKALATQSYFLVSEAAERERVLAAVRDYLADHPATAHGEFTVPLMTQALRVTPH